MRSFVNDICDYLASHISYFSFDAPDSNLYSGELIRGINGVFAVDMSAEEPNRESALEYRTIEYWAVNTNSIECYERLLAIYNLFHEQHHYNTDSYTVHFSHAASNILDMDRDSENRKMMKVSVRYLVTTIIS